MNRTHELTSMNRLKPIFVALLIATAFTGITVVASSAENKNTVLINFQVDAENTGEHLFKVLGELEGRGYTTTVFVTGSFAENNGDIIQEIQERGHEIAFHGWATGENLTTLNYSMQQKILIKAKNSVENYSGQVGGFRPQYYSQNEDTYTILDSLNISYDSGFISGLKFIPGYENYSIPYKVPNHNFYAVPVSSYRTPDKIVYLCDLSASIKFKLNATEWSSILNKEFDENKKNNEPMVVVIHPWITGNETTGYWQVFTQFLDRIDDKNIAIVKTSELLEYYVKKDDLHAILFRWFEKLPPGSIEITYDDGEFLDNTGAQLFDTHKIKKSKKQKMVYCTPPPGMVSWWPGDGNANDIQGSNHGILQNGATFAAGKVMQAISLDGVDDYVNVLNNPPLNFGAGNFSIDAWINTTTSSDVVVLLDKRSGPTPKGYHLYLWNGKPGIQMARGLGSSSCDVYPTPNVACFNYGWSSPSIADGVWHHVAWVVDRTDLQNGVRIYLDGVLNYTGRPMTEDLNTTSDLYIGMRTPAMGGGGFFRGYLDEVEIFNRALNQTDIQAIYNAGSAGKCKLGTICGVKFNDSNGNGTQDANEPGLSDWTIEIKYPNATVAAAGVTNDTGGYCVMVPAGDYTISEIQQSGWTQTYPTNRTHNVSLKAGETRQNVNFGNHPYVSPKGYGIMMYGDTNQTFVNDINKYNNNSINNITYIFPYTGEVNLTRFTFSYNITKTKYYKTNLNTLKVYPMLDSVGKLGDLNQTQIEQLAINISEILNSDNNADGLLLDIEPYNVSLINLTREIRNRTCKPISISVAIEQRSPAIFQSVDFVVLMLYGFESNVTPLINYTRDAPGYAEEFLNSAYISNGYAMIGVPAKATKNEWEYKINGTTENRTNSSDTIKMEQYLAAALNATNMARNTSNEQNYMGISIWNLKSTPGKTNNNETLFPYIISPASWNIIRENQ